MEFFIDNLSVYANIFNRRNILEFINKDNSLIQLKESKFFYANAKTYQDIYTNVYELLKKKYRCEYIYLNEIFLEQILKEHNEASAVITEFYINSSKADLLIVNGTTTIYEIKTELDTLNRLEKQLLDYIKAFDRVYVITYEGFKKNIKKFLSQNEKIKNVGIKILNGDGSLTTIKKSGSFIKNYDKEYIFKSLLKKERDFFCKDDYYRAKELFLKKSNIYVHKYFKKCLLERKKDIEFIMKLPDSLKIVGHKLQNTLNKTQKELFLKKLNTII